jgi:hypothetical protein
LSRTVEYKHAHRLKEAKEPIMATAGDLINMIKDLNHLAIRKEEYVEFAKTLAKSDPMEVLAWFQDAMASYLEVTNALYDYPEVEGVPRVRSTVYKASKKPQKVVGTLKGFKEKIAVRDDFSAFLYYQRACQEEGVLQIEILKDREVMERMARVVSVSRSYGGRESNRLHQAFIGFTLEGTDRMWAEMRRLAPHLMEHEGYPALKPAPGFMRSIQQIAEKIGGASPRSQEGQDLLTFADLLDIAIKEYNG